MKKILSALAVGMMLTTQSAEATEGDTIKVVFNGSTATATIPSTASVSKVINGAKVTLSSTTTTEEYVYDVYGTTSAGALVISGDYKLTLCLNGVAIASPSGPAIDVECGKRISVVLADGTVNTLSDAAGGTHKAAFYTTGHPEFSGSGTLNVTGNTKHAISAKEYLEIKRTTGVINVLSAVGDGIHCGKGKINNANNYFKMNGGVVNIQNVGGDCIDSDDYGTIQLNGGTLNLNVTGTDVEGLKADSLFTMEGGKISILVTGDDCSAVRSNYAAYFKGGSLNIDVQGNGSKGIKGKQQTDKTVNGGGSVYLQGTDIDILVSGGNIIAAGDTTKCMGISVDADMAHTAGSVSILACGKEARTYNVKGTESLTDGFVATAVPWAFSPYAYQYDMTAYVLLKVDGEAPTYSDYVIGAFVGDECRGIASFTTQGGYTWAEMRIRSNTASGESVSFKAYNTSTGQTYDCSESLAFTSQDTKGQPSLPTTLTTRTATSGDMDGDGQITLADVTRLISHYEAGQYVAAGDMNGDGMLNLTDIKAILQLYVSAE